MARKVGKDGPKCDYGDIIAPMVFGIYHKVELKRKAEEHFGGWWDSRESFALWLMSSTYNLHLASGCYSDKKEDKSNGRGYNSERRRCKSDVEEDKSYRGGVQHLKKRKEDVGGEGVGFSLCAAPLDRLSPRISEERSYDRGVGVGVGVGVRSSQRRNLESGRSKMRTGLC